MSAAAAAEPVPWRFWLDRGGTFTDCIALDPQGRVHTAKILSSTTAASEAVEAILARAGVSSQGLPLELKLGSTVATNALLERRGARVLLRRGLCPGIGPQRG